MFRQHTSIITLNVRFALRVLFQTINKINVSVLEIIRNGCQCVIPANALLQLIITVGNVLCVL